MADNNFRDFRGRDPIAREDVDPTADDARDPLAELARLIGQRDRIKEFDRNPRHAAVETLEEPAPATGGADLAADDGYAEPNEPARYPDEDYVQPRLPDPHPSDRAYPRDDRDDERAPPIAAHYAEPADDYDDAPEDEPAYEPRYRDDDPPRSAVRQPPGLAPQSLAPQSLAPQSYADDDETHDRWDGNPDRQSEVAEDEYDDEAPRRSRRGGLAVVLAMLGLVLVGAAGAFAYRAMFGGAILMPSLPPIIKANDGPTKIVPNPAQAGASNQAAQANPGSPEKLVSREEQPVPIQPPNAPPRVVSTIPVLPAPGAAPGAAPGGALAMAPVSPAPPASPVPPKAAAPGQPAAAAPAPAGSTEPKKVHTVTIRPDQMGGAPNVPAAVPGPAPAPPAAAARPRAPESTGVRPGPAPAPRVGGNAPLAIVPAAQGAAPPAEPPRSRVARTEAPSAPVATAPAAPPSGGGYAVQVTSQRSEAEAQTAFKSLQAKFPGQLGNRQPIIHRADLGDKGTYYRALVGPFASSEAAASMCSNLKAAGGSCLVQKN